MFALELLLMVLLMIVTGRRHECRRQRRLHGYADALTFTPP
jgi:hypothetical protein